MRLRSPSPGGTIPPPPTAGPLSSSLRWSAWSTSPRADEWSRNWRRETSASSSSERTRVFYRVGSAVEVPSVRHGSQLFRAYEVRED